jgi:hydroxysqualene synthase
MNNPSLSTQGKYWSAEEGFQYCEQIARGHYENFPVASRFVPKHLRKYVWAIYAFARTADDYADEPGFTTAERLEYLNQWEDHLDGCYNGNPTHRVFAALAETVDRFQIPIELFKNLLTAFRSDVTTTRHETFEDLLAYCRNSANPIGRLVLLLFNYRSDTMLEQSDHICTALQLTNFWQDVSIDLRKDRIYIPMEDIDAFGYSEPELLRSTFNEQFKKLMAFQVNRTAELFIEGKPLVSKVGRDLSLELKLTWNGGTTIFQKIHQNNFDVLHHRPVLNVIDKMGLLFRSIFM